MSELLVFHKVRGFRYIWWKTHKNGAVLEVYHNGKCTQIVRGRGPIYKLIAPDYSYSFAMRLLEKVRSPKDPTKIKKWRNQRIILRKLPKWNKKELRKTGQTEVRFNDLRSCIS